MTRKRIRDLGIAIGRCPPGPLNAITDVPGVQVGYATRIADEPMVLRTGVTAVWPARDDVWRNAVFAGCHSFNGNGEMTGMAWIAEQGLLNTPIAITNTHCVGIVRDMIGAYAHAQGVDLPWLLPVAAETYDGWLSTAVHSAVTPEMVFAALDSATGGPIAEGNVGGGTGMICHEFKGGTGTASRLVDAGANTWTVGVLVQANYGRRNQLTVAGVSIGEAIPVGEVPSARGSLSDSGSIIVVIGTDAPLLPIQCQRVARHAVIGLARVGGIGANGSGDLFIAFSTANRIPAEGSIHAVSMIAPEAMTRIFEAAGEATEEAILNGLTAAETMTGRQGRIARALPLDRLVEEMARPGPSRPAPA